MHRLIILSALAAIFTPSAAHAKRKAPPKVAPVIYNEVCYVAPNDDGRRAYVQAWSTNTIKMLWEVTVFRNFIVPLAEEDVQHVYIKQMSVRDGEIILTAEDSRMFAIDLKTQAIRKLKASKKPQQNTSKVNPADKQMTSP